MKRQYFQYFYILKVKLWGPLYLLSSVRSQGGKFPGNRMKQALICLARIILDLMNIKQTKVRMK